jgi:UDP-N-acetylglucosamine 2-epimerase
LVEESLMTTAKRLARLERAASVSRDEFEKMYEALRELAKTTKVPVIVPIQPRPAYRDPPEPRQGPNIVFIDYPGTLPLRRK